MWLNHAYGDDVNTFEGTVWIIPLWVCTNEIILCGRYYYVISLVLLMYVDVCMDMERSKNWVKSNW